MTATRPRVLDLFCCAGGATEAIPPAFTKWIGTAFMTARQEVFA